ncbi:DUF6882 domain-containing protein [Chenggangzhangella methanolivorans]|uniref:Uncharacterized protein n=1 Tax=Chenggangzhangella methanolivorans TaxID=1437009 RepID=A0A9E6R9X5_9HYPH|nr:DUF6882 domain-containing protein [Chenggangzhangella methanolivorans]QZO00490.1 hypothetical protein K6K41_01720 [Chenggangzhangella methanolivorans]
MASFLKRLFGKEPGAPIDAPPVLDHASTLERARNELALKTGFANQLFQLGDRAWAVDLEKGEIVFTSDDGMKATAPVQVIGTLDREKQTWMWGWDHPSVPAPCAIDAGLARDFGEKRGLAQFTTRVIPCDEQTAWDFAALAMHLSGGEGAYRGPAGPTLVYMTFGTVTLSADQPRPLRQEKDFSAGLEPVDAPDVIAHVHRYCEEIHAIERAHNALPEELQPDRFKAAIDAQQPVYERYWRRDDDYWRPCSIASHSEMDLSATTNWRTFSRGPGRYRVTYTYARAGLESPRAYDVDRFDDGLRIIDSLF